VRSNKGYCGEKNESTSFGQAHLSQMQNYQTPWRGARDLCRSAPQAASGLKNFFLSFKIAGSHFWLARRPVAERRIKRRYAAEPA
jgi:hypothetical protein